VFGETPVTGDMILYLKWTGSEEKGDTPISDVKKSDKDGRFGIRLHKNIVSDKAEMSIVLPNDKVASAKIVIYDNVGNVVASTPLSHRSAVSGTERSRSAVWDLTNTSGRKVANGTYLIIAEAKGVSGNVYWYSAKVGVKR
jgi:flagellar hook assembly protein FlgD